MATTPPDVVRSQLAVVSALAVADLEAVAASVPPQRSVSAVLEAAATVVPAYYDATGALAVAWYDELREEARPATTYTPIIIGVPATDWIEREVEKYRRTIEADVEREALLLLDEAVRLAEKEVARGFRDTITGNTQQDQDAVGWSRIARPGACKFCVMVAGRGAVYRESTATFAAHRSCHCAARPEFRNGEHGPEANAMQYLATSSTRTPAQRAQLRAYLNKHYPDAPG